MGGLLSISVRLLLRLMLLPIMIIGSIVVFVLTFLNHPSRVNWRYRSWYINVYHDDSPPARRWGRPIEKDLSTAEAQSLKAKLEKVSQ